MEESSSLSSDGFRQQQKNDEPSAHDKADVIVASIVSVMMVIVGTAMGWVLSHDSPCRVNFTLMGSVLGLATAPYIWGAISVLGMERQVRIHNFMLGSLMRRAGGMRLS